jgi:phosphinothricin acetyltransferase
LFPNNLKQDRLRAILLLLTTIETEAILLPYFVAYSNKKQRSDQMEHPASTSSYCARACYAGIAEFSVSVRRDMRGKGAGHLAMAYLPQERSSGVLETALARLCRKCSQSGLLRSLGFREVGIYEKHRQLDGV